jgi:adenylate cyclase
LLNEYLGEMTDVLFHHWGTLDKYIGDAIMGFWNSPYPQPDHAIRACSTALDMQARLKELNQKWVADGGRAIHSGVGVNTGVVNVGNMGSDKRFSWTVIGDNVNLASRLEGATKEYHVNVIVAEPTFEEAKESFVFRELDYIRVMGKQQPVRIFELLDFALKRADHEERIRLWMRGLEQYRRAAWVDAITEFEEVLKRYPDDGPSILFIERCEEKARELSVEAWDGVWVMRTK